MRRRVRRTHQETELNITAFLNLMVILIPFLLITAVFSRITILDVHIPPAVKTPLDQQKEPDEKPLQISVIIRQDSISVVDNRMGLIKQFSKEEGSFDYKGLSELLQNMKDKVPDKTDANILLEADIPYEVLVETMDAVRLVEVVQGDVRVQAELFPDISIGDAPAKQAN